MTMKATYSALMQSKFFNPAFNSAIFDGPIRIYFAQFHESLALKIYFSLQQTFAAELAKAKKTHQEIGRTVLVMLYPSEESFSMSFENEPHFLAVDDLHDDTIIGVNGPFEDDKLGEVLNKVVGAMKKWEALPRPPMAEAVL
jgi:hypothetical protein